MKRSKLLAGLLIFLLLFTACHTPTDPLVADAVAIQLSDNGITVEGTPTASDFPHGVTTANDIIYYEAGKDFTYGEGTQQDAHTKEEADAHTVVHITKPGTYALQGTLSQGQIAVDLGSDAKSDPSAVVTLILNGADITCTVAPAVIFYNVYECGNADTDTATKEVDTSAAGANILIADGTKNTVNGSYVEKIYQPETVVLNQEGTQVEDADKLHKYDGALYSRMSMNVNGGQKGDGALTINAKNEGLDSELHLTINGGNIHINSGNDGINTNEDGVSVTTVNGGNLSIRVTGATGEGDGIDSNGWLVINGGTVTAAACSTSGDAGIDSDLGIHINGGTVLASGNMLDRIENGGQTYAVFTFAQKQKGEDTVSLKNQAGTAVMEIAPQNDYSILIYSSPALAEGTYTLFSDGQPLAGQKGTMGGGMGPQGGQPPEGMEPPADGTAPKGERPQPPQGMEPPQGTQPPEDTPPQGERPKKPEGEAPDFDKGKPPQGAIGSQGEASEIFVIAKGANTFSNITPVATQ